MSHPSVPMTKAEMMILATLGAHTRGHVLHLMARCPGLRLTSGRRTPGRNRAVGGSPRSWHLWGRAADFIGEPEDLEEALALVKDQRITERCTGPEEALIHDAGSGTHLHVAW